MSLNKQSEESNLKRNLKPRHAEMVAIGGAIGVGIFMGSARTIQTAGPCILLGYLLASLIGYIILRALGEISVEHPISGSFSSYAGKYISPVMGYITGWSYWFSWVFVIMADTTAVGNYMSIWFKDVPKWVWTLAALVLLTLVNLISVKAFGEFEFWFVLIKLITIVALILVGLILLFDAFLNKNPKIGFFNLWIHGGFFPKGIFEFIKVLGLIVAGFIGIESLGLTAGEIENPKKNFPLVINRVSSKICILYIGALAVIMSLFPWNNMTLEVSPFVLAFEKIGLKSAAGIINFVVITAALSACSSVIFGASRMIYNLESQGFAPKFLGKLNKKQIPVNAVLFSSFVGFIGVILSFFFPESVFDIVFSAACVPALFIWIIILYTQIKFREKLSSSEINSLKYKSIGFPYINYLGMIFLVFIITTFIFTPDLRASVLIFPVWMLILIITYNVQKSLKSNK